MYDLKTRMKSVVLVEQRETKAFPQLFSCRFYILLQSIYSDFLQCEITKRLAIKFKICTEDFAEASVLFNCTIQICGTFINEL